MGGSFGSKEGMTVEPYLALLVWKTRRPVRMIWSRQESILASTKGHPFIMRYRTRRDQRRPDRRPGRRSHRRCWRLSVTRAHGSCSTKPPSRAARTSRRTSPCARRGFHQQRPDERVPGLRRKAGNPRLRVADGPARSRHSPWTRPTYAGVISSTKVT